MRATSVLLVGWITPMSQRQCLHTRRLMCPLDEHHCSRKLAQSSVKCDCRQHHQVSTYWLIHNPTSADSAVLRYNQSVIVLRDRKFSKNLSRPFTWAWSMTTQRVTLLLWSSETLLVYFRLTDPTLPKSSQPPRRRPLCQWTDSKIKTLNLSCYGTAYIELLCSNEVMPQCHSNNCFWF